MPDIKAAKHLSPNQVMAQESEKIAAQLQPNDVLICLDENGKEFTSRQYAGMLETFMVSGTQTLVIVIGGPYGIDKALKDRASKVIALSKLTFTHQMVRLVLAEQLYRAMTILRNEPYHHD